MELICNSSEHYISTINRDEVVKILNVDRRRKPAFREIYAVLRSTHACNLGLESEVQWYNDRMLGFSEKNCVSSSSSCDHDSYDRNSDSEGETSDDYDDLNFSSLTLKELQEICRARQQKNSAAKNGPKPDAESYSHLETFPRKRNYDFMQSIESDSDLDETLGSWKSKLFKRTKVKKRHTASEKPCSSSKSAVLHAQTAEMNILLSNGGQDSGNASLQNKRDLSGFDDIKIEAFESDCDLQITEHDPTPMDLCDEPSAEVSEKDNGSDLPTEEPIFVGHDSPCNGFQETESASEISAGAVNMGSLEIARGQLPSSLSNNKLDNAHLCGSSYSSQEHDISSHTDYRTDKMHVRPLDHGISNCHMGLISSATIRNPDGDSDEEQDATGTNSLSKDGEETKLDMVHLDQVLEEKAGFVGTDSVSKDGDEATLEMISSDRVPDQNAGLFLEMEGKMVEKLNPEQHQASIKIINHVPSDSNEDDITSGTDSVSKVDMVYLAQVPERISGFVQIVENRMVEKLNGEELPGREMPMGRSEVEISPDFVEDQYTSSTDNIYIPSQGFHPPTKLLSTRKAISPTSQEKLRMAADGEELYDNMQLPKHRKRICFEKWTKNKSSSAGSGFEEAEAIVSESISKKMKNIQHGSPPLAMKGILKSSPNAGHTTLCASSECSSIRKRSNKAIEFSQRQMQDIESLAVKLLKELKSMKNIVAENLVSEASPKYTYDEMRIATENAAELEETTKRWLSMMAKDCNRFCKIMRLPEKKVTIADGFHKERKKICFADEAGGMLCHVKVFEDQDSEESTDKGRKNQSECESSPLVL